MFEKKLSSVCAENSFKDFLKIAKVFPAFKDRGHPALRINKVILNVPINSQSACIVKTEIDRFTGAYFQFIH